MNTPSEELFKLILKIKNEPRSSKKIKMLSEFPHRDMLVEFLTYAYDSSINFNVTSKAIKTKMGGLVDKIDPMLFSKVLQLPGRAQRINYLTAMLNWYSPIARQIMLSVLDKDLNIGIGLKTINKALGDCIDDFTVMLAWKQTEERFTKNFEDVDWLYYNIKVDGIRCIVDVVGKDEIFFYSRDGKTMEDFLVDNIRYEISKNIRLFKGRMLDGEIYSDHFQKLMRIYRRKSVDMDSIYMRNSTRFAIFDLIDMEGENLVSRVSAMKSLEEAVGKMRFISFLEYHKIEKDYLKIGKLARECIRDGEEGIIIKHPYQPYEKKRSNYWLKFKNKETIDLTVVGYYSGEPNTEFENALGGLIFDFNGVELRCGSGFSRDERHELYKNPDSLIGETVELSFMEETKGGSLRHPVFERFRTDK